MAMKLSIIVPVYNRPDEVRELLESLRAQREVDYELIIVEDGSERTCKQEVELMRPNLKHIIYMAIPNAGPSGARNFGSRAATGDYLIFLDSDVTLPEGYLKEVEHGICLDGLDAFGGPDAASKDFTPMQQAINYAMTSPLTTGGIRGGRASGMEQFKPRSFNLGCRRSLFQRLGGFDEGMRFGEDIDFSLRLIASGARVGLIPKAFVYHKRRVDLGKFFKQVHNSGIARIHIETRHPGSTRLVHWLPALFTLLSALCILSGLGSTLLLLLGIILFFPALGSGLEPRVAGLAVVASFVQLWGYGTGFIRAWWGKHVMKEGEFTAFKDNFYQ